MQVPTPLEPLAQYVKSCTQAVSKEEMSLTTRLLSRYMYILAGSYQGGRIFCCDKVVVVFSESGTSYQVKDLPELYQELVTGLSSRFQGKHSVIQNC